MKSLSQLSTVKLLFTIDDETDAIATIAYTQNCIN